MSTVEELIKSASTGGWDWFDRFNAEMGKRLPNADKAQTLDAADGDTIRTAFKAFYATPEGRKAMQWLCDQSLNRPIYLTHQGMGAEQIAIYGAFREGQNNIVHSILRVIESDGPSDKTKQAREA